MPAFVPAPAAQQLFPPAQRCPTAPIPSSRSHPQELVVTETTENVTWLTQGAYDRLKDELDFLAGEGRAEIVKRIEQAREEGDLRENGGYHAAKDEQGKREARIRQLQQLLDGAKGGVPPAGPAGQVAPGTIVTAVVAGEEMRFLVGSREAAGDSLEVYSEKSPLGAAILGKKEGDSTSYDAPNGTQIAVEIKT